MKNLFKSRRSKILLSAVLALFLGIIFAAVSYDSVSPLSSAVSFVFSPLQSLSARIASAAEDFTASFRSAGSYRDQLDEIRLELENYREQLVDYEEMKQKLASYENFLGVKQEHPDFEFVPSTIISRDAADMFNSFLLNSGSVDGVEVNDPVIYESYLVGVVSEVNLTTCLVRTMLDPKINISCYEVRSREDGYTENTSLLALGGLSKFTGLTRSTSVQAGGIVCTSGVGGKFPRDLIIGTVKEVKDSETDISTYATIEPGVNVQNLIDVFVITDFLGK